MKGQNPSDWLDISMFWYAYMSVEITVVTVLSNVFMWDDSPVFSSVQHHLKLAKSEYLMLPQIQEKKCGFGGPLPHTQHRCEMTQGAKQQGGKPHMFKADTEPH